MQQNKLRYLIYVTANKLSVYVQYKKFIQIKYVSDLTEDYLSIEGFNSKKLIHDPQTLLFNKKKRDIIAIIKQHLTNFPQDKTVLFASSFYDQLSQFDCQQWIGEIYQQTGLFFNILSVELETFYYNKGMIGNYKKHDPLLLISITDINTILTVVQDGQVITTHKINFGTQTIVEEFPQLKKRYASTPIKNVVKRCLKELPQLSYDLRYAVYGGGKLDFMQTLSYDLQGNTLYEDREHPALITVEDFIRRNKDLFSLVTIKDLLHNQLKSGIKGKNPRAEFALAQAICEKYKIRNVVPSNTSVLHGVAKQEFRRVVISQSIQIKKAKNEKLSVKKTFAREKMQELIKMLNKSGTQVLSPQIVTTNIAKKNKEKLQASCRQTIAVADALIILNHDGYISYEVMLDIGFAQALGKRIVFIEDPVFPKEVILTTEVLLPKKGLPIPAEVGLCKNLELSK